MYRSSTGEIIAQVFESSTVAIGRKTNTGAFAVSTGHGIVVTYDGGTAASGIKIYVDGVQADTTDANIGSGFSGVPSSTTNPLTLGIEYGLGNWAGYLGEIGLWEREVSSDERAGITGLLGRWVKAQ